MSKRFKAMRAARVAAGNCGFCNQPRGRLKWLCDACGEKHATRQRLRVCFWCDGAGQFGDDVAEPIPCHVCAGEGKLFAKDARQLKKEMGES